MITTSGASAAQQKHIEALRAKHAALESRIHEEQKFPAANTAVLRELKLQKLRLKEEIEQEQSA